MRRTGFTGSDKRYEALEPVVLAASLAMGEGPLWGGAQIGTVKVVQRNRKKPEKTSGYRDASPLASASKFGENAQISGRFRAVFGTFCKKNDQIMEWPPSEALGVGNGDEDGIVCRRIGRHLRIQTAPASKRLFFKQNFFNDRSKLTFYYLHSSVTP